MSQHKSRFIKNTFYYMLAPLLRNAVTFATLPIITRRINPEDYGVINMLTAVAMLGTIPAASITGATTRYYFAYKDSGRELGEMLASNLYFMLCCSVLFLAAAGFFFEPINNAVFRGAVPFHWFAVAALQYALVYINAANQTLIQNQHQGRNWFFNEACATGVYAVLSVAFVMYGLKWQAIILAGLLSEVIKMGLAFMRVRNLYIFRFNPELLKESLLYAWPQAPSSLLGLAYAYFDKFIMNRLKGMFQVGILDMSSRFGLVLKMAMDGVGGTLSPLTLEMITDGSPAAMQKLARIQLKVIALLLFIGLFVILISKDLVILLTTPAYYQVINVIPVYIYYQVFGVLGTISYWLIYHNPKKTYLQIPFNLLGLVVGTAANFLLIPRYGLMGAAFAMFFSMGLVQVLQFFVGLRLTPVPVDTKRVALLFCAIFIETAFLYYLYWLELGRPLEILCKTVLLALFPALCLVSGVATKEDLKLFSDIIKEKMAGLRPAVKQ